MRQDLEPATGWSAPLAFGTAIHRGLEVYYDPETWHSTVKSPLALAAFLESWEAVKPDDYERMGLWEEHQVLGYEMLKGYFAWAPIEDAAFTPVYTEIEFEVEIPLTSSQYWLGMPIQVEAIGGVLYYNLEPVVYQGRIDLIVEDAQGKYWIVDHKTEAKREDILDFLQLDTQMKSYAWAVQQQLNIPVAGMVHNRLVKEYPQEPKVLASGRLSTDKRQNTTYAKFLEKVASLGQKPILYQEFLKFLLDNPREYFRRQRVIYSPRELELAGQAILFEAVDMLNDPSIYPNPHPFTCKLCPFKGPCQVKWSGGEEQFVLESNYTKRDT